jgi:hypothetical protein
MPEKQTAFDQERVPTKYGTEFVTKFYRLLKGSILYDRKNVIIDRLTDECLEVINATVKSDGHLFFKMVRDNFYFNNVKIHVGADKYSIFKSLWQEMRRRWIGELQFREVSMKKSSALALIVGFLALVGMGMDVSTDIDFSPIVSWAPAEPKWGETLVITYEEIVTLLNRLEDTLKEVAKAL